MRRSSSPGNDARTPFGNTAPWIGANFWSRSGGPRMWKRYDATIVRQELEVLLEHGCNVTRSFCFWPDFVPEPKRLDEEVLARFSDFLTAHTELGLGTIPTFLVGHMSGENFDPPWRDGRDLYRDSWMVDHQAWFASEIARRFGSHPAVVGWLVSNEMPLYGGRGTSEEISSWARTIVQAVRSAGATQPISLGDGAWGVEISGDDNGYSLRALAPLVDFIGPHVYPMQDDQLRQFLTPAFVCELCAAFGKPVVLEEFGVSSDFSSDGHAADYYRQVLHTTLLAGSRGWLAWNNCDYDDLWNEDPYRHHAFEMHFGLTDRLGRPKPQLRELGEFAVLVRELAETGWERVAGEAAIVVPEHFERVLPFTEASYRRDIRDNLLQGYIAAREADLPVELLRERDGIAGGARLYISPSTKLLTAPGLRRLRDLATGGATVYVSYFAGSTANQRGPWLTWLDEIFGIRQTLRYGLVDPISSDEVTFEFVSDFGDIPTGTRLGFRVAGEPGARSYLPVECVGAEIVAVDDAGRPALLRHAVGEGTTVFCTYPIEHFAAHSSSANPESTWRIYSALAELADVSRPVRVADPRVLVGRVSGPGFERAIFVNWSGDAIAPEPIVADGVHLRIGTEGLALDPYGVAVVHCDRPGTPAEPIEPGEAEPIEQARGGMRSPEQASI